ncbi:hypothetical protein CW304_23875 [Bacillus sp. UFRGS-B20]|nr:hypothetical protein CW304_23875 [Bacillus sp. UFRGS-B20]
MQQPHQKPFCVNGFICFKFNFRSHHPIVGNFTDCSFFFTQDKRIPTLFDNINLSISLATTLQYFALFF